MLQVYKSEDKSWYDDFFKEKMRDIICFSNDDYTEVIRDMIINYQKNGYFDIEPIIDDIRVVNCSIAEQIAQTAIDNGITIGHWNDDDDYFQFVVDTADDILDSIFLGQDILICIQEMIYDTAKKYDLAVMMKKGMFFEYPEILQMYCKKGEVINNLPDDNETVIHANHAQLVMFDELLDNEPSFYGRNNILLYEDKEQKEKTNLLEG